MENKDKQLILTEADLLGQGAHKKVYRHPEDPARCVKICFKEDDEDIRRELDYRHRCKRTYYSQMLPKYCGTVETNLGTGYVFELVRDFDGQMSRTLQTYLENPGLCEAYFHTNLAGMLAELKKELETDLFLSSVMEPYNFCVERVTPATYRFRCIDDLGASSWIPLPYYFQHFALSRIRRYWRRFTDHLQADYGVTLTRQVDGTTERIADVNRTV